VKPLAQALLAQALAVPVGLTLLALWPASWPQLSAIWLQGAVAAVIALVQRAPRWWLPLHLLLPPLGAQLLAAAFSPHWFLVAFLLLLLVYWRADESRVPLYLSNAATCAALLALLPRRPCQVLDLGCGLGGPLRALARARPDCQFTGIEHAPLPWLWARIACASLPNVRVLRGDFWRHALTPYDVIYAFLSPAPMARLGEKAAAEMRPGTLLVSNSFPIPDWAAETVEVADRRRTQLYCYGGAEKIGEQNEVQGARRAATVAYQ